MATFHLNGTAWVGGGILSFDSILMLQLLTREDPTLYELATLLLVTIALPIAGYATFLPVRWRPPAGSTAAQRTQWQAAIANRLLLPALVLTVLAVYPLFIQVHYLFGSLLPLGVVYAALQTRFFTKSLTRQWADAARPNEVASQRPR